MITTFAVAGYRSLVDLVVPLAPLTVVSGANGTGKTSLYRALRLLAAAGAGELVGAVAREGGLASALWAGPERPAGPGAQGTVRSRPVSLRLGVGSAEYGYLVELGQPQVDPARSFFLHDPEIKREQVFMGAAPRPSAVFIDRTRGAARVRDAGWRAVPQALGPGQSVLLDLDDAGTLADTLRLRTRMAEWRCYDHFRTDRAAPARQAQVGTRTRWLSDDGADLAAVWATAIERGQDGPLAGAVAEAFPGSRVEITVTHGVFELLLHQPGLLRPLSAAELSDGTLRYLLLCAALLPAEPPPLIVLNEPEGSLHAELLAPLGALIRRAAERTQVLVVTHAPTLRAALTGAAAGAGAAGSAAPGAEIELESTGWGTRVRGQGPLDGPPWSWPAR